MPLEKASRSPRVCSCRGRYRSWASTEPSSGKPLKAVFAARTRIERGGGLDVEEHRSNWSRRTPPPRAARSRCAAASVSQLPGSPRGRRRCSTYWTSDDQRQGRDPGEHDDGGDAPMSGQRGRAALWLLGGLNAGTPLEMASTPVSAVQSRTRRRAAREDQGQAGQPGVAGLGHDRPPGALGDAAASAEELSDEPGGDHDERRRRRTGTSGAAKIRPDSRTPRRFIAASSATNPRAIATRYGFSPGNAEMMLSDAGGDRDRDGQDVVDQQRAGHHQRRRTAPRFVVATS